METTTQKTCKTIKSGQRITLDEPPDKLRYSLRRYYVDEFYSRYIVTLPPQIAVLDLGGTKILKRGLFDIEQYSLNVCYANLLTNKSPDVQCDAAYLPFTGSSFDAVICAEMFEHVQNPMHVLSEIYRVLNAEGTLLISVPFLHQIHGEPYDYGRYTGTWWGENLTAFGFTDIIIEYQGFFASVLVDMLRDLAAHKKGWPPIWRKLFRWGGKHVIYWGKEKAVTWDNDVASRQTDFAGWYCNYTTGFGIRAVKQG